MRELAEKEDRQEREALDRLVLDEQLPIIRLGIVVGVGLMLVLTWVETRLLGYVAPPPLWITATVVLATVAVVAQTWVPLLRRAVGGSMVALFATIGWHTSLYAPYALHEPETQLLLGQFALGMFGVLLAPDLWILVTFMALMVLEPLALEALGAAPPVLTVRGMLWLGLLGFTMVPLGFVRLGAQRRALAALRRSARLAAEDPLTGLWNRRRFEEQAGHVIRDEPRVGVLFVDVDHFKRINDRQGHAAGDRVLRSVGEVLRRGVREGDLVARVGGEEFAVLLAGAGSDEARAVGERLRAAVASDPACGATISVGLALRRSGEDLDELLRRADRAMYAAKAGGRDRVVLDEAA